MKVAAFASCLASAAAFVPLGVQHVSRACRSIAAPRSLSAPRMAAEEEYPDTELTRKFGSLRGAQVKPVSETVKAFNLLFPKPTLHSYRTIVNELLQNTHLTVVDARFKYDPIFGYGFVAVYDNFMRSYPGKDKDEIFPAIAKALELDPVKMRADAVAVVEWAEGKNEEELLAIFRGDQDGGELGPVFRDVRENDFFLYSRMWGIGLFSMMEKVGIEPSQESVERWMDALGLNSVKAKVDLDQYNINMERIAQAEQMFKEIEIREKRKLAQRLEEKAKKALEAAERAEQRAAAAAADEPAEEVVEAA